MPKFGHFGPKSINFLNLNEILHVTYFEFVNLKSDIDF